MPDPLTSYIEGGYKKVDGWLSEIALDAIACIANVQVEKGICGGACEIGVHHGKLFLLLHFLTRKSEKSTAYDLFSKQDENVDGSGVGDRSIFEKNIQVHGGVQERIIIVEKNSMDLTPESIITDANGKIRLFSVDGGHTSEITKNDLSIAFSSISQGGVVILDDFFNEAWPAVAEGTCKFIKESNQTVYPVAILGNKFILTNCPILANDYIYSLQKLSNKYIDKMSEVFDHKVLILLTPKSKLKQYLRKTSLWSALKQMSFGVKIRRILLLGFDL